MSRKDYIYSTSELAAYYGLTRKGLAFYEEKGIISPSRGNNGKYRVYSLSDCYSLYHAKLYENSGYSLAEIASALKNDDLQDTITHLETHTESIRRKLEIQKRACECIERITAVLRQAGEPIFEIKDSPAFCRLFVRTYETDHNSTPEEALEFQHWNEHVPIDVASLRYSRINLSQRKTLDVNIGNIIREEDLHFLGLSEIGSRIEHIPSHRCLYTILTGRADEINCRDWLEPALKWICDHGLTLADDPYTALLAVTIEDGQKIRRDEAWFPIE